MSSTDISIGTFRRAGFAVLRGQSWTYLMRNSHIIIGRSPRCSSKEWLVDIDIGPSRYVARQHILIIYNFDEQRFEVRCLSKRGNMKVDGKVYRYQDGAIPLKNRSVVGIHKESFLFLLPG